jgi:hypothetical protein
MHTKDKKLLETIRNLFGVGTVRVYEKNSLAYFTVNRIEELSVIIAHFDKYPLISQKRSDFELFKSSHKLISHKEHLTKEGLDKLIAIKASINQGLILILKEAFPNISPIQRPTFKLPIDIKPQ